jgi:ABC-type dipeptide/oligopeptide/nickel transport system permease component
LVSKKYSSLLLKPAASTILLLFLIVWLYFAFAPLIKTAPRGIFIDYGPFTDPKTTFRWIDLNRFSSLGMFLTGLLHGDFGISIYTGYPVLTEVSSHLPVTLSLIGISTALSFVSTSIIIQIASILKPVKKEPRDASVKSTENRLPELSFSIDFLLLLALSLPQASIQQLHYLALPSITLAIIFLARGLMVLHRGSQILSESWPRKLLFAASTINFSFVISIVVFVEAIFNFSGIGLFLVKCIPIFDYNGMIGAVITLVTLATLLSYLATAIDLAMRMSGLQETLEKEHSNALQKKKSPLSDINRRSSLGLRAGNGISVHKPRNRSPAFLVQLSLNIPVSVMAPFQPTG